MTKQITIGNMRTGLKNAAEVLMVVGRTECENVGISKERFARILRIAEQHTTFNRREVRRVLASEGMTNFSRQQEHRDKVRALTEGTSHTAVPNEVYDALMAIADGAPSLLDRDMAEKWIESCEGDNGKGIIGRAWTRHLDWKGYGR